MRQGGRVSVERRDCVCGGGGEGQCICWVKMVGTRCVWGGGGGECVYV